MRLAGYVLVTFYTVYVKILFIFLSEDREVYVAFGVLLEVNHERVGMCHRGVEVVVEAWVGHQTSDGAVLAVEFGSHLIYVSQCLVDLLLCRSKVEGCKI